MKTNRSTDTRLATTAGGWRRALAGVALAAAGLLLAACGGGGDGGSGGALPTAVATAPLEVTVHDSLGRFVGGATVDSGSDQATTDASGKATVAVATGGEHVVAISKAGFAEQVRVVELATGAAGGQLEAMLVAREPAVSVPAIEAGGVAAGKHGVTVEFPAGALVDPAGRPVTGTIDLFMTPLDVSTSDLAAFPGVFEGVAPGVARSPIMTFGTSELVPQQGGQKLQLAAGQSAVVELPIYVTTLADGTVIHAGDTLPLWSLDPGTGVWTQEGTGTVVARAASPSGLALRASIAHFSWWNVDQFASRATVDVVVNAVGTTVPAGTQATLRAQVVAGTGPATTASTTATVGVAQAVAVAAPATLRFDAAFDVGDLTCNGSTTASATPGATTTATVLATCIQVPTPTIVAPAAISSTNSSAPTRVQIVVDGPMPDSIELLADGVVVATFGPQFFYVHLLDTGALPEGGVSLQARATLAGKVRTGNTVALVVDRTPPHATQILPDASVQVSRGTTLTVEFDEPVNAFPFVLADAVTLSVTLPGAPAPTPIAADIALDAAGTTLAVTPAADLPAGTLALGWGGLRDAAGNAVAGTVAATWQVDRSAFVGPLLSHFSSGGVMGAALVFEGTGSLLVAHRPDPGTFISLSRYDAAAGTWNVVVPALNERPARNLLQMATDAAGIVYIAFVQETAAGADTFELVLKRFDGTKVVDAAPAVALVGARGNDISQGSMAIDAANRPVLAFTGPNLGDVHVFRLEAGTLVPLATVTTLAADPQLALEADGTPVVAYLQGVGGSNAATVRVARIVAGVVQPVGGAIDSVPNATQGLGQPRLIMLGSEPWVFWNKFDGFTRRTHAASFDGVNWIDRPLPVAIEGDGLAAGLLEGDPVLVVASPDGLQVLRFHAGAWELPFDATGRTGRADRLQLAIRGASAAIVSSNGNLAEVQRLLFP